MSDWEGPFIKTITREEALKLYPEHAEQINELRSP